MKKVLIIDDDHDLLFIMNRWIGQHDPDHIQVTTIDNGTDAKMAVINESWDLVITDVRLKDCTGLELAQLVKSKNDGCGVLMVTGYASTDVSIDALNMHVEAFLLKPLDKTLFVTKVVELLNKGNSLALPKKVLAIGAHPDDVEIGCGGTLFKHQLNGDQICILTLTNGEQGGTATIRSVESYQASQLLHAKLIFGNLTDTEVGQGAETIQVIEKVIQEFKPDIVYTHSEHDAHQDHRNCFKATVVAARMIKNLSCYQSPSSTIDFKPTRFADIDEMLDKKLTLIQCYQSQYQKCRYLKQSLIKATAEYWGRYSSYGMVEPFEVIRSV